MSTTRRKGEGGSTGWEKGGGKGESTRDRGFASRSADSRCKCLSALGKEGCWFLIEVKGVREREKEGRSGVDLFGGAASRNQDKLRSFSGNYPSKSVNIPPLAKDGKKQSGGRKREGRPED